MNYVAITLLIGLCRAVEEMTMGSKFHIGAAFALESETPHEGFERYARLKNQLLQELTEETHVQRPSPYDAGVRRG